MKTHAQNKFAFVILLAIAATLIGGIYSLKNHANRTNLSGSLHSNKAEGDGPKAPHALQSIKQTSPEVKQRIRAELNRAFATSAEVEKFLKSSSRTPIDYAMCGIIARRSDLIEQAKNLNPNDEATNLVYIFSNLDKNLSNENIEDLRQHHPASGWPEILTAKLAIKNKEPQKALDAIRNLAGKQTLMDTTGPVMESFREFLMEVKSTSPREAQSKEIGDLDDLASSYTICSNLITEFSELAINRTSESDQLLIAAWQIAEDTQQWGYAWQAFESLSKQKEMAEKIGSQEFAKLLQQDPHQFETALNEAFAKARADFRDVGKFKKSASDDLFAEFNLLAKEMGEIDAYKAVLKKME